VCQGQKGKRQGQLPVLSLGMLLGCSCRWVLGAARIHQLTQLTLVLCACGNVHNPRKDVRQTIQSVTPFTATLASNDH
jgi:hypothetical protein